MGMGMSEIDRFLEQWQTGIKDLRRRMILGLAPWRRQRWYAILYPTRSFRPSFRYYNDDS